MKKNNETSIGNSIVRYKLQLMGIAALLIIVFHEYKPIFSSVTILSTIESFIKAVSFVGVDIFIFISGFGIVFSINKNGIRNYYIRRLIRIYVPVLIFAGLLILRNEVSLRNILLDITGYNFYAISIFSFLWYIPAIVTFYLLFPIYYYFLTKNEPKKITIVALIVWYILTILTKNILRTDLYLFTNRIPIFILGIYFGEKAYKKENTVINNNLLLILLITGVLLQYLTIFKSLYILVPVSYCCLPNILFTIGFLPLCCKALSTIQKTCINKALIFLGTISLELYIVQEKLGDTIIGVFSNNFNVIYVNIMYFMILICSSLLLNRISIKISNILLK